MEAQGQAQLCNGGPEGLVNGEVVGGGGVVDRYGEGAVALGGDALYLGDSCVDVYYGDGGGGDADVGVGGENVPVEIVIERANGELVAGLGGGEGLEDAVGVDDLGGDPVLGLVFEPEVYVGAPFTVDSHPHVLAAPELLAEVGLVEGVWGV